MFNATTGQLNPCPTCNSDRVRWRGRRIYDMPLTWTRASIEMMIGALQGGPRGKAASYSWQQVRGNYRSEILEANTGWKTARYYWRCQNCRNRGQIFEPKRRDPRVEDRTRPPSDP